MHACLDEAWFSGSFNLSFFLIDEHWLYQNSHYHPFLLGQKWNIVLNSNVSERPSIVGVFLIVHTDNP